MIFRKDRKIIFNHSKVSVFIVSLIFYLLLWIFNPTNKIIIGFFLLLILAYQLIFKKIRISLLFAFISSLIILTGKTYDIQLVPEGIFPMEWWPNGYIVRPIITPSHILGILLLLVIFFDIIHQSKYIKNFQFGKCDFLITGFFLWQILSSVFGSANPGASLVFTLLGIHILVAYFYIRIYISSNKILYSLISLFAAILVFESFVSVRQFIVSSPIGKNIEAQQTIEDFGQAVDESAFRFRPVGTFNHANDLGSVLPFSLFIFFSVFYTTASFWFLFLFITGFILLVLTLSRSSWLAFLFGFLVLIYILDKKMHYKFPIVPSKYISVLIIVVMLIVGFFFIFPRLEKTLYSFSDIEGGGGYVRQLQIEIASNLIILHPVFGVGAGMSIPEGLEFDSYGVIAGFPSPVHNAYLLMAAENGIPALILYLSFVIVYAKKIINKISGFNLAKHDKTILLSFLTGIFSFFIVALFQPNFNQTYTVIFLPFMDKILEKQT